MAEITDSYIDQCYAANELGDGTLFAAIHQGRYLYAANSGEWYRWADHCWQRDIHDSAATACEAVAAQYLRRADSLAAELKELAAGGHQDAAARVAKRIEGYHRRADRLRSARGVNNCLRFARIAADGRLSIDSSQFDRQPHLLACANGVICLKSGNLRPGRPDDLITLASPVEYRGIDYTSEDWDQFISDILDGDLDLADYIGRILGLAIIGAYTTSDFYCLTGRGRNGKTVMLETIGQHVLGPLAGPVPAEMLLDQPNSRAANAASPDIMQLRGMRLCWASETDEGRKFSASRVKWLTGGDMLTGRYPHDRYPVNFQPTHTLFLLTNHRPSVSADDYAFWERARLIHFPLSFIKDREPIHAQGERAADPKLEARLHRPETLSGILSWLVRHCIKAQLHGITPPDAVRSATSDYRTEQDVVQEWIDACCELDPYASATAVGLNTSWQHWFEANVSRRAPSPRWLGLRLSKRFNKRKTRQGYVYDGLRLTEWYDQ